MTTYDWPAMRDRAIERFNGDTPGADLEARILTHFREHPGKVATLIEAIGRRVTNGQVNSGWAILARELDTKPANIQADDNAERAKHLRLAEIWIRNTGGYIDSQDELEDEMFGDRGPLRDWPELKPSIVALWTEQRPRFTVAELEHVERLERYAAARLKRITVSQRPKPPTTEAPFDPREAEAIAATLEQPEDQ